MTFLKDLPNGQLLVVLVRSGDGSTTIRAFQNIDALVHALKAEDLKIYRIARAATA